MANSFCFDIPPGEKGDKGDIGPVGVNWRDDIANGDWLNTGVYYKNDGVYYKGSSYRSKMDYNVGNPPDIADLVWKLIAKGMEPEVIAPEYDLPYSPTIDWRANKGIVTAGNNVISWDNQVSTGQQLAQPEDLYRPQTRMDAELGKPVVGFIRTTKDMMQYPPISPNGSFTMFFVAYAALVDHMVVWSEVEDDGKFLIGRFFNYGNNLKFQLVDSSHFGGVYTETAPTMYPNHWYLISYVRNTGVENGTQLYINGVASGNPTTSIPGSGNAVVGGIGALMRSVPESHLQGDIANIVMYNGVALSNAERGEVEAKLRVRWGL